LPLFLWSFFLRFLYSPSSAFWKYCMLTAAMMRDWNIVRRDSVCVQRPRNDGG
jgi:hypothetical protein